MSRLAPPAGAPPRRRAGGRSAEVRRRVAAACLELLAEGEVGFGPVEVARRAGVSRATLHRWWPTKDALLREALAHHTRVLRVPDTGTWEADVRALAAQLAAFFEAPVELSLNALMASGAHPDLTAAVLEHYEPLFVEWRALVERARSRGEVGAGVDPDAVLLALVSPLVVVPLLFRRPLGRSEGERLVSLVLRATAPRAGGRRGP